MINLNLPERIKKDIRRFIEYLKTVYQNDLISVIIYGSAVSGEYMRGQSNINLLVILRNDNISDFGRLRKILSKLKLNMFNPLFFSEKFLRESNDVFPVEFLDIKENYLVLEGKDIMKDLEIDMRNLRFQCEQELKEKIINLKHLYLRNKNKTTLKTIIFGSFNSILHILRNVLRIRGIQPPYLKIEIIKALHDNFAIDMSAWERVLSARNKKIKLKDSEIEELFIYLVSDLEKIANIVDKY